MRIRYGIAIAALLLCAPLSAQSLSTAGRLGALPPITSYPYLETFDAAVTAPADWTVDGGTGGDPWQGVTSAASEPFAGAVVDHTSGTGNLWWVNDSQPPYAVNSGFATPIFDLTSTTAPRLQFWYQNARTNTGQPISVLTVVVSTDGGVNYGLPVLTVNMALTAWTQFSVDLTPYKASANVRIKFVANEAGSSTSFQTNSDPSLDDVSVNETPAVPAYSVSPSDAGGPVSLGTVGACAGTTQSQQLFTITNTGAGTLGVTSATLAGGAGFSLDASSLPASLGAGQTTTVLVTFAPAVGASGVQTAVLTISYNDGTARTDEIDLTATATAANVALGAGGGYAFVNSNATCTASATTPAPSGTAFISVAGHSFISSADWNDSDGGTPGDDSYFTLDEATLDGLIGSVRFFGTTYESLAINSNGAIGFDPTWETVPPTLPTSTGGGVIYVGAMDASLTSAYNADNTGQARAGAYYGLANVDGVGPDELVITFFHIYDRLAPINTRYYTAQLVVFKGAPNEDDSFEIRYPGGNDLFGVPFYNQVTVGGFPPVASDLEVGIGNPEGTAAAVYRVNGVGGELFNPSGVAIRFTPQTQAVASGGPGWRLMGAPVNGFTVGRLAEMNLVQSVAGQYPAFAADNLLTGYDPGSAAPTAPYVPATSTADVLAPGRGFFWYLFDQDLDPGATNPEGTSRSYALPMALQGTGAAPATDQTLTLAPGFNMLANPFRASLNVAPATVASWAQGGALASSVVQTWDPAMGSYTTLPGDVSTAWQGFFVQNAESGGATELVVPTAAQTTGGTFVGRAAPTLAFRLEGTATATGARTTDVAATLAVSDDATDGWDLLDASKLSPMLGAYATVGFQGLGHDGAPAVKAQESRATGATSFSVPLVIDAVGTAPALALSWSGLEALPATWQVELRDMVTGAVVDLRTQGSYAFEQTAAVARASEALIAQTTTAAQRPAGAAPRFELVVTAGRATATAPGAPGAFALAAPAPNPTAGAALVRYDVPEASHVSVALYDLLGRRVAVLADGESAVGAHEARLDASALAPGVYVVRMTAGAFVATQRVTVVR